MGAIARVIQTQNSETEEEDELPNIIQTVEAHFNDSKYCEQFAPSGDDSPPLPEDRVLIVDVEGTGNAVSCGNLTESQGANPGEKILYSRNPDDKKLVSKIYLKNDGTIQLSSLQDDEVKSSLTLKSDGTFEINGEADTTLTIKGNLTIKIDGDAKIEVGGNCDLKATQTTINGNTKVTGGMFEAGGTVTPTGQGALCGIPFCVFSGAPQCGNISQGT